jgi:hypothetical protein
MAVCPDVIFDDDTKDFSMALLAVTLRSCCEAGVLVLHMANSKKEKSPTHPHPCFHTLVSFDVMRR